MKLKILFEYLKKYKIVEDSYDYELELFSLSNNSFDPIELSENIYNFFKAVVEGHAITNDLVNSYIKDINKFHQSKIPGSKELLATAFNKTVDFKIPPPKIHKSLNDKLKFCPEDTDYNSIFKLYLLLLKTKICDKKESIYDELVFCLNSSIIHGKEIDLSYDESITLPLFPLYYAPKIIKSNRYIKDIFRLAIIGETGGFGDCVYYAFDIKKNKFMYIRHVPEFNCSLKRQPVENGVFASKIVNFLDLSKNKSPEKRDFSSERILNRNRSVASRHLPSFIPFQDGDKIPQGIVLTNTGMLHVLLHFINEKDMTVKNIGRSCKDVSSKQCRLVKIDFDHCSFGKEGYFPLYNKPIKLLSDLYGTDKYHNHSKFKLEKTIILLKICLLTEGCLQICADKSFTNKIDKNNAVECANSQVLSTINYLKYSSVVTCNKHGIKILLNDVSEKFIIYLEKHENHRKNLSNIILSIKKRTAFLHEKLKLNI